MDFCELGFRGLSRPLKGADVAPCIGLGLGSGTTFEGVCGGLPCSEEAGI